jgi:hypothetical protein
MWLLENSGGRAGDSCAQAIAVVLAMTTEKHSNHRCIACGDGGTKFFNSHFAAGLVSLAA